jgi:ABC-type methionine transport system ATPase subunit
MSISNLRVLPIYCPFELLQTPPKVMKRKLFCTIPQKLIQQPLLFTLVNRFKVVPNIRGASVTETIAILSLELEGDDANVEEAVAYLKEEGVQVEVLEDGHERTV